jgi:uncharacterized repeat protein (TIGR01451 family)
VQPIHRPLIGRISTLRSGLAAAAICGLILVLAAAFAPGAGAAAGEFQTLTPSSVPLTSVTVDPSTNLIYAQENQGQNFFSYDPRTDAWTELELSPLASGNNGGAAYLNGKIYTVYTNTESELGVYDIASNTWTTIPNPLEEGTGNITAVGGSLYLAVGTKFVKYDPSTETTTTLAEAPEFNSGCGGGFERWGGLQPYQGKIYGHQGDGCTGFGVYDIASDSWSELPIVPEEEEGGAVLGSAIDPVSGTYFTYGNYDGSNFYSYSIGANSWTTIPSPLSEIGDGGMAYVSLPGLRGIYAVQGEQGTAFVRYTTPEPEADLSLTKSASVANTTVGGSITYTIKVTNAGPSAAGNVTVSDPLPANVSLVSSTATQGSCTGSSTVSCNLGTLESGASATLTLTVTANAAGTAANTASVEGDVVDPNPANNSASASTVIAAPVAKTPSGTTAPRTPPPPPPLLPARWLVPNGVLTVARGWVSDPLLNLNSALTLSGSAQLVVYVAGGTSSPTVLATNSVYLTAGATKTLFLHLNSAALSLLSSKHRFVVQLQLTLNDQLGRQTKPTGVYLLSGPAGKHSAQKHK